MSPTVAAAAPKSSTLGGTPFSTFTDDLADENRFVRNGLAAYQAGNFADAAFLFSGNQFLTQLAGRFDTLIALADRFVPQHTPTLRHLRIVLIAQAAAAAALPSYNPEAGNAEQVATGWNTVLGGQDFTHMLEVLQKIGMDYASATSRRALR